MTSLYDIQHKLICDSSDESWYVPDRPIDSFRYRWSIDAGSDIPQPVNHYGYAVHRGDPCLTLAWGLPMDGHEERADYEWMASTPFAQKSVRPFCADFFWHGGLVDRVLLASIDGGDGIVPLPTRGSNGFEVTDFEVSVAFLVSGLGESHDSPSWLLDALDFRQVRDEARHGAGWVHD